MWLIPQGFLALSLFKQHRGKLYPQTVQSERRTFYISIIDRIIFFWGFVYFFKVLTLFRDRASSSFFSSIRPFVAISKLRLMFSVGMPFSPRLLMIFSSPSVSGDFFPFILYSILEALFFTYYCCETEGEPFRVGFLIINHHESMRLAKDSFR